jgi:hypothetical protein
LVANKKVLDAVIKRTENVAGYRLLLSLLEQKCIHSTQWIQTMNAAEIQARLKHYRGSDILAHLTPTMLLTEGALYLAQAAKCFWLFNLYASHLAEIDGDLDWFNCLKLSKQREGPRVLIEDGNDKVLAQQSVDYTDFSTRQHHPLRLLV